MKIFTNLIRITLIIAFGANIIAIDSEACFFRRPWHYGSQGTTTETVSQKAKNPKNTGERNQTSQAEPVYLHNGDFVYDKSDLLVPSRGIPVEITRKYSAQSLHNGQFGYGWDINYYKRIVPLTNGDLFYLDG